MQPIDGEYGVAGFSESERSNETRDRTGLLWSWNPAL